MNSKTFPKLIYGTAWKKEKTSELVEKALTLGFLGLDTACQPKHYNEEAVGLALEKLGCQRKIFIQTKFTPLAGQDPHHLPYDPKASLKDQVSQSLKTSLKNLKTDVIDSWVLHSPLPSFEQTMEVWHAMEEYCKQGLVRSIGISNCYDLDTFQAIYNQSIIKPSCLQNRFYRESGYDKELRQFCIKNNIHYQSFWTLTANPHLLNHPILKEIASQKNVNEPQVFFRFLTEQKIIPLIGTCSENHMREDLAIFNFTLTEEEMSQINSLF